jgi:hypothetical protein
MRHAPCATSACVCKGGARGLAELLVLTSKAEYRLFEALLLTF